MLVPHVPPAKRWLLEMPTTTAPAVIRDLKQVAQHVRALRQSGKTIMRVKTAAVATNVTEAQKEPTSTNVQ